MKDYLILIGIIVVLLLSIASDIAQDRKILDLQDQVKDMNEQIVYVEGELE